VRFLPWLDFVTVVDAYLQQAAYRTENRIVSTHKEMAYIWILKYLIYIEEIRKAHLYEAKALRKKNIKIKQLIPDGVNIMRFI
jgi:hypothetical protein